MANGIVLYSVAFLFLACPTKPFPSTADDVMLELIIIQLVEIIDIWIDIINEGRILIMEEKMGKRRIPTISANSRIIIYK